MEQFQSLTQAHAWADSHAQGALSFIVNSRPYECISTPYGLKLTPKILDGKYVHPITISIGDAEMRAELSVAKRRVNNELVQLTRMPDKRVMCTGCHLEIITEDNLIRVPLYISSPLLGPEEMNPGTMPWHRACWAAKLVETKHLEHADTIKTLLDGFMTLGAEQQDAHRILQEYMRLMGLVHAPKLYYYTFTNPHGVRKLFVMAENRQFAETRVCELLAENNITDEFNSRHLIETSVDHVLLYW